MVRLCDGGGSFLALVAIASFCFLSSGDSVRRRERMRGPELWTKGYAAYIPHTYVACGLTLDSCLVPAVMPTVCFVLSHFVYVGSTEV